MAVTFTNPQEALDALDKTRRVWAFIGGEPVEPVSFSAQFGVRQQHATASLQLDLSDGRPAALTDNAEVEVIAGFDGFTGRVFHGFIPAWDGVVSARGQWLTVHPIGWSRLLAFPFRFDLQWSGPISPREIFLALCEMRGVPAVRADLMTAPDGVTSITVGGNAYVDDGMVTLPGGRDPLRWLAGICEPFGYRIFDTPDGVVRLQRVSGLPPFDSEDLGDTIVHFRDTTNVSRVARGYDVSTIINYHEVTGPTYEDAIGATIPIRSLPESITPDDRIPVNDGIHFQSYSNTLLVTQEMADVVRQVREVDQSEPTYEFDWDGIGLPLVSVGDTVAVTSFTINKVTGGDFLSDLVAALPVPLWLTELDLSVSERAGFSGRYTGWAGAGSALASGEDLTIIPLQISAVHAGDEYVGWYSQPSPVGTELSWEIEIPERATAVNIVFEVHGSNSQYIGGQNEDLTISKWEMWRPEDTERPSASGNLPVIDENYAQQLDYTQDQYWTRAAVSLRGTDAGIVTFKLVCGENRNLPAGTKYDDFEIRNAYIHVYGVSLPTLPDEVQLV